MIDKLTDVYNKWGDKNNLQPLGSADEELIGRKNLTKEQKEWLEKFIEKVFHIFCLSKKFKIL